HQNRDALARLSSLVKLEPRDPESQLALGKLLYAERDLDGAEAHLREALVYAQNDASALYTLGLVLAKKSQQEQANGIFDRLERVTPGRPYAPYGRAAAAALAHNQDDALKWLAIALERGIEDPGEVERDESFSGLAETPRFRELLAAARNRAPPKK